MMTLDDIRGRAVIPIWPDTGQLLGLSRDSTYRACDCGEIPTLRFGSRRVVPVPKLLALLGDSSPDIADDARAAAARARFQKAEAEYLAAKAELDVADGGP